jgi:hypothetical protein
MWRTGSARNKEGIVMALGTKTKMWWEIILEIAKFFARVPLALVVIASCGLVSWVILLLVYRATQFLVTNYLSQPW